MFIIYLKHVHIYMYTTYYFIYYTTLRVIAMLPRALVIHLLLVLMQLSLSEDNETFGVMSVD